ncbi:MAG TPA: DUF1571 domain-containing protein [Gemmataceae bacterium]|nr:DUF1571 domain-containing protein [Gemmataceae bacterium]
MPSIILAGLALLCVAPMVIAQPAGSAPAEFSAVTIVPQTQPRNVPLAENDILGTWNKAAAAAFQKVRDYQCMFVKQERIDGTLQEEQIALMRVRNQPFSVSLKFQAPKSMAGRGAAYIAGKNNNQLRAKGPLGFATFSLDPHDPKAMLGTRHAITEAGLGHLIDEINAAAQARPKTEGADALRVSINEVQINRKGCVRIDVTDPTADGKKSHYRSVIYFDKDTNLPIRIENYDRLRANGPATGELVECFTYLDLKFNIGLTDAAFVP